MTPQQKHRSAIDKKDNNNTAKATEDKKMMTEVNDKKMTVRFLFSIRKDETLPISRAHCEILEYMVKSFDAKIFDADGKPLDTLDYPCGQVEMDKHFAINESYNRYRKLLTIGSRDSHLIASSVTSHVSVRIRP